ncbi:MAG: T9SS type A sorting domain-containing protein [Flavobacteriales bacterium]|nr:T9SS type A sorting domain-containing protein [Flavobacteriales bacterium]
MIIRYTGLLMMVLAAISINTQAQVFFTEDFEGPMDPGTDLPTGWLETGSSTDGIWSTGDATAASSAYITWPVPSTGTNFAYTNDDDCNCDKSVDRIYLPTQNFTGMVAVNLTADVYLNGGYGEMLTLEISTDGGTTWVNEHTFGTDANNWQENITVDLTSYAGNSSVIISFLYNDAGVWAYGAGIDNVELTQLASADDIGIVDVAGEYTRIPARQSTAMTLEADVSNNGVTNVVDAQVISNVYLGGSLVFADTSAGNIINVGDTNTISVGTYAPTAVGSYDVEYIISSAGITDNNALNDTAWYSFDVTQTAYSRENGSVTASIGVNGMGNTAIITTLFDVNAAGTLDSVASIHNSAVFGDTVQFFVYNMNADTPNAIIGMSPFYVITGADTLGPKFTPVVPITATGGGALTLNPGQYFIGVQEFTTTNNYALDVTSGIFTPMTSYVNVNNGPWTTIEDAGFPSAPSIWGFFTNCSPTITSTMAELDPSCFGSTDGTAIAAGVGGTFPPYTYSWDANTGSQTTGTAVNLGVGTYVVTIEDGAGCTITDTATLQQPTALTASATDNGNNSAIVTAGGGTPSYSYMWDASAGSQTTQVATGLTQGNTYTVTVTDANGCTVTDTVTIPVIVSLSNVDAVQAVKVYPNPATDLVNIYAPNLEAQEGVAFISLTDVSGKQISAQTQYAGNSLYQIDVANFAAGTYFLKLNDGFQTTVRRIDIIK